MDSISPKYQMSLVRKIYDAIWTEYSSYADVLFYITKWHEEKINNLYAIWENFSIKFKDNTKDSANPKIDLLATLHSMDGELLLKIAIDLGIETPDFIPSIPIFRNEVKSHYKTASQTFEKAFKCIESDPDTAVGLVNSALESIIKEILKDERISVSYSETDTLYSLLKAIMKAFNLSADDLPTEIKTLNKSLLSASQAIERLRSDKTLFHGKTDADYIIDEPLYVYFIVNSVSSIGLFLMSFYQKKYPKLKDQTQENTFNPDDLPF